MGCCSSVYFVSLFKVNNMGREILFRAKCFGNWRYGNYVHFVKKPTNSRCNINYKDFIITNEDDGEHYYPITDLSSVGQYTGLKDKKGNKIFEGDILTGRNCRFVVKYDERQAEFVAVNSTLPKGFGLPMSQTWIDKTNKVICGNIHDNPKLIK